MFFQLEKTFLNSESKVKNKKTKTKSQISENKVPKL